MRIPWRYSHNFAFPADLCESRCHIRTTSRFPLTYANTLAIFAQLPASLCLMRIPMPYSHNFAFPSDLCESHDDIRTTSHFLLTYANTEAIFAYLPVSRRLIRITEIRVRSSYAFY